MDNEVKVENTKKSKKIIIIPTIILLIIVAAISVYYSFFNYRIEWKEKGDYKLNYINASKVKLAVNASEKVNKKFLKVKTTCGSAENQKGKITWDLTEAKGECEITVSYKMKKISKKYTVIEFDNEKEELNLGEEKIDLDSDEDIDYDGLTNKQETELGTNPRIADTDMDGLEDGKEVNETKTDPLKADTDGDGLNDYDEIELELDPLKADSKGDGKKDGERKLSYTQKNDNVTVTVNGTGNIASTLAKVTNNTKISSQDGMIDKLYTFYTDGNLESATVIIEYTDEELTANGINEDNLTLYYYNPEKNKYEAVDTKIDKENNTITATLKHFSNYVLGDKEKVKETKDVEVLLVLDNSWSLYSNEQYEEITGSEINEELDAYDSEGVRFEVSKKLVKSLEEKNYKIGLSEFRRDYENAYKIGSSSEDITKKLDDMTGKFITSTEGTNISNALTNGMNEFSKNADEKYIVLLTDGYDDGLKSSIQSIVKTALNKNVKICSVGFGGSTYNDSLSSISNQTGCKLFSSNDSSGLKELFKNIDVELNNDIVDIDEDGENDGLLLADSGFIASRDGFSFENYGSTTSEGGHCYGMATFANLYYTKNLPFKNDDVTVDEVTAKSYDLTKSSINNNKTSLYDYKLKSNALKYVFGFDTFDEEEPTDLYTVDDDNLEYSKTYLEEIKKADYLETKKEKTGLSSEAQIEKHGVNYKTYTDVYFDDKTKMQTSTEIDSNDKELFNAIHQLFIKQNRDEYITSSSNLTLRLRNLFGTESTLEVGKDNFMNVLEQRIKNGEAPVISSSFSGGLHAINAISLVQDIDNPNIYYIGVYDNNYVGEKRYVTMECKKDICYTKANEYYTSSKEPVRMTPSLEYELKYFE